MKVLFISAWYPNRYDEMSGLFVRKHALSVSLYCEVQVLYIHPSVDIQNIETEIKVIGNIKETIIYFPANSDTFFNKIFKQINYFSAYIKGWNIVKKSDFTPDIIHVNVLTRTGLIAYLVNKTTKIPYVIIEHWTRYLQNRNSYNGVIRKFITEIIANHASAIFPVSENLKQAMVSHNIKNKNYKVINNVVDDFFFEKIEINKKTKINILHVSCFDDSAKNITGLLSAIKLLSEKRTDFELKLIGTGVDFEKIFKFSKNLNFPEGMIHFEGEKPPIEVAKFMQKSDFFVLFSNYENSPVVISESLACGKPVISTNVGGISEHINDTNGLLIAPGDTKALAESIDYMLDHFDKFDADFIQSTAKSKFSMKSVGKELQQEYLKVLKRNY